MQIDLYKKYIYNRQFLLLHLSRYDFLCRYQANIYMYDKNIPLKIGDIPNDTKYLVFTDIFDQQLHEGIIPESVIKIRFGRGFNKPLKPNVIPKNVKMIIFGAQFNQDIKIGNIPDNITDIVFGYYFNGSIEKGSLNKVEYLTFGEMFDKELKEGDIPNTVKHLIFRRNEKTVNKCIIPNSIVHLQYINSNKINLNNIPENLMSLQIKGDINNIKGVIPNNIIFLSLESYFNVPIEKGDLPDSIQYLRLAYNFNQELGDHNLPKNLKYLKLGDCFDKPLRNSTILNNCKEIVILNSDYDINLLNIDNKVLIGIGYISDYTEYIRYLNFDVNITSYEHENIHKYILNSYLQNDKLIGKVIYKELIQRLLNINNIKNMHNMHNIKFEDISNYY